MTVGTATNLYKKRDKRLIEDSVPLDQPALSGLTRFIVTRQTM
ncbi:hypothetical protein [Domibacillus indicus]|nr:hypothetical protein [Domibacillus indicus]